MASSLFEQYRPITWDSLVGQDAAKAVIAGWRKRGLTGRAVFISGNSGSGKTTCARLMASEAADETAIREIDAGKLTEASVEDEIRKLRPLALFGEKQGRVLIVNEAHRLKRDVVGAFLTLMEPDDGGMPGHVLLIFTTTSDGLDKFEDGQFDAKPFLSRCNKLPLARRGISEPFAKRAAEIARLEGLAPAEMTDEILLGKCLRLAKDSANNLREMLGRIEDGCLLAN